MMGLPAQPLTVVLSDVFPRAINPNQKGGLHVSRDYYPQDVGILPVFISQE